MSSLAQFLDPAVIQEVGRLDLRARFIVEGFLAGLHSSPLRGFSVEFSEHRKYVPGDDPRSIDWKVYARTDRLFVRQYQAETHLACHVLVDTSASMGYVGALGPGGPASAFDPSPAGGPWPQPAAKLLYAVHLAAALGYLVTRQRDAVGLGLLGEGGLLELRPARSRRAHLVDLLRVLSGVIPRGTTGLAQGIGAALGRVPHRGVIVLISDLLTDMGAVLEALHHIRYRGHDLIVFHVLDAAETTFPFEGPVRLEDPESGATLVVEAGGVRAAYRAALERWRGELRTRITALRGDYVALDTATPFDKALIEFLVERSRRR